MGFAETDLLMIFAGVGFDVKLLGDDGFEKFGLTTKGARDVATFVANLGDSTFVVKRDGSAFVVNRDDSTFDAKRCDSTLAANRGDCCDEKRSPATRVGATSLCRSRSEQDSEKLSSVKE